MKAINDIGFSAVNKSSKIKNHTTSWITFLWWISLQTQKVLLMKTYLQFLSSDLKSYPLSKTSALFRWLTEMHLKFAHVFKDFPDSSVVQTSPSIAVGAGSIPVSGAKISHALLPKDLNIKQKQYWNILTKRTLKMVQTKKSLKKLICMCLIV